MKKFILLILTTLMLQFHSNAQNEKQKTQLKFYYNFNRINFYETFDFIENDYIWISPEVTTHSAGELSIALLLNSKSSITHELELMPFALSNTGLVKTFAYPDDYEWNIVQKESTSWNTRFRYQLNYPVITKEKFRSYLGLFSMVNYFQSNFKAYTTSDFPERYSKAGIVFGLTPGMEFTLSEKLNLSIDVPVGVYGLNLNSMKYELPSLPASERNQSKLSSELWHQGFQVRIGFGVNL